MAFERRSGEACKLWYSWQLPALSHWEVGEGGTRGSEEVSGAKLATRSTPFLSRERPTVGVGGVGGENVVLKDREAIQTGV